MSTDHPITPPPELVQQWWEATIPNIETSVKDQLCTQAARWGADQELEACCEWTQCYAECGDSLRNARRPKPPSLKEQALALLDDASDRLDAAHENTIRRALEALPND